MRHGQGTYTYNDSGIKVHVRTRVSLARLTTLLERPQPCIGDMGGVSCDNVHVDLLCMAVC